MGSGTHNHSCTVLPGSGLMQDIDVHFIQYWSVMNEMVNRWSNPASAISLITCLSKISGNLCNRRVSLKLGCSTIYSNI